MKCGGDQVIMEGPSTLAKADDSDGGEGAAPMPPSCEELAVGRIRVFRHCTNRKSGESARKKVCASEPSAASRFVNVFEHERSCATKGVHAIPSTSGAGNEAGV